MEWRDVTCITGHNEPSPWGLFLFDNLLTNFPEVYTLVVRQQFCFSIYKSCCRPPSVKLFGKICMLLVSVTKVKRLKIGFWDFGHLCSESSATQAAKCWHKNRQGWAVCACHWCMLTTSAQLSAPLTFDVLPTPYYLLFSSW